MSKDVIPSSGVGSHIIYRRLVQISAVEKAGEVRREGIHQRGSAVLSTCAGKTHVSISIAPETRARLYM